MRQYQGLYYDPRLKLVLILLTSALAFALGGGFTGLLLFGIVFLFAVLSGLWKVSVRFAVVYIALLMLAQVLPIHLSSVITFFLLRMLTIAFALNILFQTTEITELITSLQTSHIPQAIVIPLAIILRFLPSLKQDALYISQGMKTRGAGLSFWRVISHPAQTYKTKKPWALFIFCAVTGLYGFYPPMIICCILAGIISALIAWKTGCTNGKTLTISYTIYMVLAAFSGMYIPFLFFSQQTLKQYAGMFGESYLGVLNTLASPVTAIVMLVVVAICAFIGALIALKLLKKHFQKAGMV